MRKTYLKSLKANIYDTCVASKDGIAVMMYMAQRDHPRCAMTIAFGRIDQ
jgi:hypothetical protein